MYKFLLDFYVVSNKLLYIEYLEYVKYIYNKINSVYILLEIKSI